MGIRFVKTAAAVYLSILAAKLLHLNYALSARLIAVLGIDGTLKRSLNTILVRIAATRGGNRHARPLNRSWNVPLPKH
ncbi:aromatic acid exporter family protein [Paenibacillus piri]|uniref:aromatic acid exporter family protein n=1 Tax=Paenibacillus piri TaxID=2547395 RepID=UPI003CCC8E1F